LRNYNKEHSVKNDQKKQRTRLDKIILWFAVAGAIYHLISTQYLFVSTIAHQNIHFAFSGVLVLLIFLKKFPKQWPLFAVLITLFIIATGYVGVFFPALEERVGFPTFMDLIIGILLIILALELSRQAFGLIIPILAGVFILYDFFGHYLPEPFYHMEFGIDYVVSQLSIGLSGMYGTALGVSVNYIFLFFVFGGILERSAALQFFESLGKLAGRKLRGGPAQTAVIASTLVGMVTGSAMANVAVVGKFTIPLMKKVGYKPVDAGAIEAAASSGGQIMPPVMAAAAFLMSGITGIPYVEIAIASIIPALFYFLSIAFYVELNARSRNVGTVHQEVDMRRMMLTLPCFALPLIVLSILLLIGYTPMFAAFWATLLIVIASAITDKLIKRDGIVDRLLDGIEDGAIGGAKIGVVSATLGFLMATMTLTGIGPRLSSMVSEWSLGILVVACIMTMIINIILGMGVPTIVAYALCAMFAAPVMINFGVPLLQAHLFNLYFAVYSGLTPPVAMAALVASQIAGSDYMKTGWKAFFITLPSFIIAYAMIWNTSLNLQFKSLDTGIFSILTVLICLFTIAVVVNNFFRTKLAFWERMLWTLCCIVLFSYVFSVNYIFLVAGIGLLVFLVICQNIKYKNQRKLMPELAA
jgi:TRAP transporter 4TM/12TM fusion protein